MSHTSARRMPNGAEFEQRLAATVIPNQELLMTLAQDLGTVWKLSTDTRLKQRIVHLVLRGIIADFDAQSCEVKLVLHWAGGRHSEVGWIKTELDGQDDRARYRRWK